MAQRLEIPLESRRLAISRRIKTQKPQPQILENTIETTGEYYLFIARVYLLLNVDSKFLREFAYLWTNAILE